MGVGSPQPQGFWAELDLRFKVIGGIITALAVAVGIYYLMQSNEHQSCSVAGRVFVVGSNNPAIGTNVGYVSASDQPTKLAITEADGAFSANCTNADDGRGAGQTFELVTWNRPNFRIPGLPCLNPGAPTYSGERIRASGQHVGVILPVQGC